MCENLFLFLVAQPAALKTRSLFAKREAKKLCKGLFSLSLPESRDGSSGGGVGAEPPENILFAQTLHKSVFKKVTPKTFNM